MTWLPYTVYAVYFLLVIVTYFVLRKKNPEANNATFITSGLALFDFATSCLFVWEMYTQPDNFALFIASVVCVSVAFGVNIILVFVLIFTELRKSEVVEKYLERYSWIAAAAAFLSGANFGVISILNSHIWDAPLFKIGWNPGTELKVGTLGLVGNIVEDIPQFVIQIIGVVKFGSSSPITILSLAATSVSLVLTFLRRIFLFLVLRHGPTARKRRDLKKSQRESRNTKEEIEMVQ